MVVKNSSYKHINLKIYFLTPYTTDWNAIISLHNVHDMVLGILLPVYSPWLCSGLQLASLALGLRTLVGTGLRHRHISCIARQRCFHAYFSWGDVPGGKQTGWNLPGGNIPVTVKQLFFQHSIGRLSVILYGPTPIDFASSLMFDVKE